MVTFLLLLDDSLYFRDVLFAAIPLSDPVNHFFRMVHFVVVHQDVRRFLEEKVKHHKQRHERNQLKYNDKVEPVQFQQVKAPQ